MICEANIEADILPQFTEEFDVIVPVDENDLIGPMDEAQVYEYLDNVEELDTDEEYNYYIQELDTDEEDPQEDQFHFSFVDFFLMLFSAIFQ